MKIKITADSSIDLPKEVIKDKNISILPFNILLNDKECLDGVNLTSEEIINEYNKTKNLPKTSSISEYTYQEFFKSFVEQGYKVIHFSISSKVSSTFNNALRASKEFNNDVQIIDTQSLSGGVGIACLYACDLIENGLNFEDIVQKCTEKVKTIQTSFVIENLAFLHKGGRCSSLQLLGANLLKIRPCIEIHDGVMLMMRKYRGVYSKVCENYVLDTLRLSNDIDLNYCVIAHTPIDEKILMNAKEQLTNFGFKNVLTVKTGATVTSHCGENTIGIMFFNGENYGII